MSAAAVARRFSSAVVEADHGTLHELLSEDVWFRCLLPRGLVEHHDREQAIATIAGWYGNAEDRVVKQTYHHTTGTREHVGWHVQLRPDWAPAVWHDIEQVGYVRVVDQRIRRVDLVCTGFQEHQHHHLPERSST